MKRIVNFFEHTPEGRNVCLAIAAVILYLLTIPLIPAVFTPLYFASLMSVLYTVGIIGGKYQRFYELNQNPSNWITSTETPPDSP